MIKFKAPVYCMFWSSHQILYIYQFLNDLKLYNLHGFLSSDLTPLQTSILQWQEYHIQYSVAPVTAVPDL